MERFFGVFEPDRQVVGRIFLQQQPKGVMTLVDGKADLRPAFHDDTFVPGGELVRDDVGAPYHTERGIGLPTNGSREQLVERHRQFTLRVGLAAEGDI